MIHVCKNPEMGGGFHFLAHGLNVFKNQLTPCDGSIFTAVRRFDIEPACSL